MINRILPLNSTAFLGRSPRVSRNNTVFFASSSIITPVIPKRSFWKGILNYWPTMVMGMISGAMGIGVYQYVDFAHHHPNGIDSSGHEGHNHGHTEGETTKTTGSATSTEKPTTDPNTAAKIKAGWIFCPDHDRWEPPPESKVPKMGWGS